jgi:hypothetical protein
MTYRVTIFVQPVRVLKPDMPTEAVERAKLIEQRDAANDKLRQLAKQLQQTELVADLL